jgi:hypothetical protein
MGQQCTNQTSIIPTNELDKIPKIIFTRYLYVKDEVKLALTTSLLDKKDKALFWAYELYYSGFEIELFNHLWKIYFDFYYTLNPSFYEYFVKKQKEWKKMNVGPTRDKIINMIVNDLIMRPYNLDTFLLRQIVTNFDIELEEPSHVVFDHIEFINISQLNKLFINKNYTHIAEFVLHKCKDQYLNELLDFVSKYFKSNTDKKKFLEHKINKNLLIVKTEKRHMILAYIMLQFTIVEEVKMGKKLYVIIEEKDIIPFETIYSNYESSFYPYKILPIVYLHGIDEDNYLSLFKLKRNSINLHDAYFRHWEYYAAYSPVWYERIKKYKGTVNHELKKIDFPNDDFFEEFYDEYNYETDEQKTETTNKSIKNVVKERTWVQFYKLHKTNGLFVPDTEFLEELDEIEY